MGISDRKSSLWNDTREREGALSYQGGIQSYVFNL